jgi:hypothetical protein
MPGLISVNEFVDESREDVSSPTTSTFVSRMSQCRQTVAALEEVSLDNFFALVCQKADVTNLSITNVGGDNQGWQLPASVKITPSVVVSFSHGSLN